MTGKWRKCLIYKGLKAFDVYRENLVKCRKISQNEQRAIEKIRLLFFIVKGVTCAIIKQINKSEVVEEETKC